MMDLPQDRCQKCCMPLNNHGCMAPTTCCCCPDRSPRNANLKLEPRCDKELDCSTKLCKIFGKHDTDPYPEYPCIKSKKFKNFEHNTLGSPIGLISSNVNFKADNKSADIIQVRFATYLKAFARLHLSPESTWNSAVIDEVMKDGLTLYTHSEKEENNLLSPPEIYSSIERQILREFEIMGCKFQVELMSKFNAEQTTISKGDPDRPGEGGDGSLSDLPLENIKYALKNFFRKHKYCLLSIGQFYVLIWRTKGVYFVLDVCGRRLKDFISDKEKGVAMLICLKALNNVKHLLLNLSDLTELEPCIMREMKIVKVVTPTGNIIQRDYILRTHQYEIINDNYAYLKANLHLSLNRAEVLRNRSALPVGIMAILTSKIDHPATWDSKLVDRIMCFGVNFCKVCWAKCNSADPIDVDEFPTYFNIGQFRATIEVVPRKYEGIWRCVPRFKYMDLAQAIDRAFTAGDTKLLLQINFQMYAIWRKNGFIYLLDPFRHRIFGLPGQPANVEDMEKHATVRMFRPFEEFMNVLNSILLDSNRSSPFYLHVIKIRNIQLKDKKDATTSADEEPVIGDDGEVKSINEAICFEEPEDLCQKLLGEVSDYEDEDLFSAVYELELKTSSSEPEEIEEEEGGAGPIEELDGLETSSSGDDGGHSRKTKGGKGAKSKGGKGKGGKGKGSSGKGGKSAKRGKAKGKKASILSDDDADDGYGKKRKYGEITVDAAKQNVADYKTAAGVDKSKTDSANKNSSQNESDDQTGTEQDQDKYKDKVKGRDKEKEMDKDKGKGTEKDGDLDKDKDKDRGLDKDKENDKDAINASEQDNIKDKRDKSNGKATEKSIDKDNQKDSDEARRTEFDKLKAEREKREELYKDRQKEKEKEREKDKERELELERDRQREKEKGMQIVKGSENEEERERLNKLEREMKGLDNKIRIESVRDHELKRNRLDVSEDSSQKMRRCSRHGVRSSLSTMLKTIDGAEADDECEEIVRPIRHIFQAPNPNCYPGYFKYPLDMAVIGSESGSYGSLSKLICAGFRAADRLFAMTPWGNFVLFRCTDNRYRYYFLYEGCTCDINRFRHLDLSVGTAGLICFPDVHEIIQYIRCIRRLRRNSDNFTQTVTAYDICRQYCGEN